MTEPESEDTMSKRKLLGASKNAIRLDSSPKHYESDPKGQTLWINYRWLYQSIMKQSKRCVNLDATTAARSLGSRADRNLQTI
jgi:hypothetical protein